MIESRPLHVLLALLILALAAFNLLDNITAQPVYAFDEGRHAASAAEMIRSHQLLVTTYGGQPDYYNAKPPLSMWGAALGLALSSNPFLGVRLFSMLAALCTAGLLYVYARRLAGWQAGLLAALLFVTLPMIILRHCARTADPDMLFITFISAAMLALAQGRARLIGLGFGLLGLGFLTKSFHVLPYGLVAVLYVLLLCLRGELRWREGLLWPWCFFLPVLPWALARYLADGTAFFHVMVYYDLLARTTQVVEAHYAPPMFYVDTILDQLGPAILTLLICLGNRDCRRLFRRSPVILIVLWCLLPLTLYSLVQSKLYWYVYPQLTALALLVAVCAITALRGGLHRVPALIAAIVLLGGVVVNEQLILQVIPNYSMSQNPVAAALIKVAAESPGPTTVYIDPAADFTRQQDWFATAELLGHVHMANGGKAAYAADSNPHRYLITQPDALISHP